jgi:ribonuclease-3 family protein
MNELISNTADFNELSENEIIQLNPLVWAYIGDAVYEVYIRTYIIAKGRKTSGDLHRMSIKYAKAGAQSQILEEIIPYLTEEEIDALMARRDLIVAKLTAGSGNGPLKR